MAPPSAGLISSIRPGEEIRVTIPGNICGDGVADLRFRLAPRGYRLQAGENRLVLWARLRNGDWVWGETVVTYMCAEPR